MRQWRAACPWPSQPSVEITEVVLCGRTGWVVPSDSVRDLEDAILEAASHPQKALQFAESGRLRFDERFTREKMLQSYRGIYRELLNGVSDGR